MSCQQKSPLYVLPHGIEVIGEYAATGKNRYWRVRIRPHPFFPNAPVVSNGICIQRSRVILAAKLGRALTPEEHAHHRDENRDNDAASNLKSLSAGEHNRHHKLGTTHSIEAKCQISRSVSLAISEGRLAPPKVDWTGRKHTEQAKQKISDTRKARIALGLINAPTPPSNKGQKLSALTKQKMSIAKLSYWEKRKGI